MTPSSNSGPGRCVSPHTAVLPGFIRGVWHFLFAIRVVRQTAVSLDICVVFCFCVQYY